MIPFESSPPLITPPEEPGFDAYGNFGGCVYDRAGDSSPLVATSRRRAQNREAQRSFRDRKQRRVQFLEDELKNLVSRYDKLRADHESLIAAKLALEAGLKSKQEDQEKVAKFCIKVNICKKCFTGASSIDSVEMVTTNHDN